MGVALCATGLMVGWWGVRTIGSDIWRALPAVPAALAVHATQLSLAGLGWWCLLPLPKPHPLRAMRGRWIREAVNTIFPLGGLSGAVVATRIIARDARLQMPIATATVTADLTCEAAALGPFLVCALVTVALLEPGKLSPGRAALAVLPIMLGAAGFVLAQRAGLMRLIEAAARRLGFGAAMEGLHDSLMALHARPQQFLRAISLQSIGWSLGGAEVFVILHAIGHPVSPATAFAMEGLGMAGRSLGFALPVGLAAQEAGFVLAGTLFGVPPADAIALSMVKRVRELIVGLTGVATWQFGEWRR